MNESRIEVGSGSPSFLTDFPKKVVKKVKNSIHNVIHMFDKWKAWINRRFMLLIHIIHNKFVINQQKNTHFYIP
ncbi:hypothetical protein SINU_10650 [Sporolactobacillus inulinus CASD]|uniref:Uncharacterized protein n=1 Tax=Sporolactobacillus inulinus CASD TaxID=1069536 RepID=A0A0U1QMB3_9BACL|nr:hypothetical protein SINU_10650 [Sporolactobacillus inulinus CASD]